MGPAGRESKGRRPGGVVRETPVRGTDRERTPDPPRPAVGPTMHQAIGRGPAVGRAKSARAGPIGRNGCLASAGNGETPRPSGALPRI
jgi:hypothetical protein